VFHRIKFRDSLLIGAMLLVLAASACGTDATPAPTEPSEALPETETPSEGAPELLFRLEDGDENVHSVAFSPDGELIAGGVFEAIRLWQVNDGALARTLECGHAVQDLAFSPDGSLLGAGQGVYGVQLVQAADGQEPRQLHAGYDNRLAFSPDGETVATGNRDGVIWLWRVEDGEQLAEFEPPIDEWVTTLAFSPDGALVAAGHGDGTVYLWQVGDGRLLHTLESQTDFCEANDLAFSPDGELLAVAGGQREFDDVVRLWRVADGSIDQELPLAQKGRAVAFSPDGRWLAAGSSEELTLWEMPEGTPWHTLDHMTLSEDPDWITSLAFSPDSALLAAGRWIGVLELWQVEP